MSPAPPAGPGRARREPSAEEVAAIVAAVEVAWPRPGPPPGDGRMQSPWRFSNRWWGRGRRPRP
ncbi:MAG TPA: hypothetical protein VFO65_11395 [Acidimicrobiales bacterium]|nr:hypothetical protein [Acidimicrobiales bacterium]